MSLLEHLEELRGRIIVVAVTVVLAGILGFFLSEPIVGILRAALPEGQDTLIQISVGESLSVRLRVGLYVGIAIALPVILYQLWRFVTPGLTRSERRLIWPMLIASIILFGIGISIGYFVIPFALEFLLGLSLPGVETQLRLSEYVSFVSTVMLAFGLAFQFPVLLLVLARVRILNYRFLSARRRYAIVLIVLFAIIITPGGDPLSSSVLSLVMYVLFEGTLQIIRTMGK